MSDVRLTDPNVELEGGRINCIATDLVLDSSSRRRPGADGDRRALVHDSDDGLTVNWQDDYPGGVTIRGAVRFPGEIEKATVGSLSLKLRTPRQAFFISGPSGTRRLTLDPTDPNPPPEFGPGEPRVRTITHVDVAVELEDLRAMVAKLQSRVAELEAAP